MAVLKIRKYGDPVLRQKAARQETFDAALAQQAADMIETMREAKGIGLAANQVGASNALCVVEIGMVIEGAEPRAFVNPVIAAATGALVKAEEGCLSIPEVNDDVERPDRIRVQFQDLEGAAHEEEFEGMLARVLQHEVDHLNGIFFVDRLGPLRRKLLSKKLKELAEQTLRELAEEKSKRKGSGQ
jgi:peptide deformylase